MASKYVTEVPSSQEKKQEPVLKDEDEKYLEKQISTDEAAKQSEGDGLATKITDEGEEREASKEEQAQAGDNIIIPETQPEGGGGDAQQDVLQRASYDDELKEKATAAKAARKAKKDKWMELPSQEDAEAATKGFHEQAKREAQTTEATKKTWKSYLPSIRPSSQKADDQQPSTEAGDDNTQRTWKDYASTYVPSIPSLPAGWMAKSGGKDASSPEVVYNEDGTVNEAATKENQEREVSALLDNLNLSTINNRVFALSAETQKYYERFAQVLKDIIAGAPTAYEDLDQLMREAGPRLEKQFNSLPPFLQTLVKSLPMKIGASLGPELLAASAEKPGADMETKTEAASRPDSGINLSETTTGEDGKKKKKRRIPGLKSLVGEKSAVAGMLRSAVTFLQTRFPFLASMTNVVMSLAVFILMLVFWYCHKRGKEVRLAREAEGESEEGDVDIEVSSDEADEDEELVKRIDEQAKVLSQPTPAEVPLPDEGKDGKGAAMEGEKAVGV